MVAVSADTPADGQKVATELSLTYPILSDIYKNFIKQYGVLHPTEGIARPSMFIVNKEGKIAWKYVGKDARDRTPIETVLQQTTSVKKGYHTPKGATSRHVNKASPAPATQKVTLP